MKRVRVVDSRSNARFSKVGLEFVAVLDADHVEVVNGFSPDRFVGQANWAAQRSEEFVVAPGHFTTFSVPLPQVLKLRAQDSRLDGIEPGVVPLDLVEILPRLAVVA